VTSVRLVLTPESVVAAEARRTFTALALYGYSVDLVVANRVFPGGDDEWRQGWATAQAAQLAKIRDSFAGVEVRELQYRAQEPIGSAALREVAGELYGPTDDPAALGTPRAQLQVEADEDGYVLRMALPLAERGAVTASRSGDDLVVTVGTNRRVLSLPAILKRCDVVSGSFDGEQLQVRFRREQTGE